MCPDLHGKRNGVLDVSRGASALGPEAQFIPAPCREHPDDDAEQRIGHRRERMILLHQGQGLVPETGESGKSSEQPDDEKQADFRREDVAGVEAGPEVADGQAAQQVHGQGAEREVGLRYQILHTRTKQVAKNTADKAAEADDNELYHSLFNVAD